MRKLTAALASLSLLAFAGGAAAQERSFVGVYTVNASLGNVGDFTVNYNQTNAAYEATIERRLTGFARSLAGNSQDYDYSTRGTVGANGALRPSAYRHSGGRRGRVVEVRFTANDVVTTSNPPGMGMGDPPATPAQKRGSIDQVSAIASMLVAEGDPCARTIPVFMDGRSRFDFVMSPNGRVAVNTRAFQGEAIRCRVQYRPIAGFGDPQEAAELTFLFAPTPSGMFAPIRIQMPTDDAGVVTLEARTLTVNGTRLR
jgi:hypothetical protein